MRTALPNGGLNLKKNIAAAGLWRKQPEVRCRKYHLSWTEKQWPVNKVFYKMGQSRPVFVYLRPFLITISISIDGVLGIWTHGRRMVDADITTEQWLKLFLVCSIGWIRSNFIWLIPDSYFYGWRRIVSNWQNLKCFKRLWSAKKVWFSLHGFWCFVTPGLRRLEKNNANLKAYSEDYCYSAATCN